MVARIADTPEEVRRAFKDEVHIFLQEGEDIGETLRKAPPPGMQLFVLTLEDVEKSDWIGSARNAGWVFLGTDPSGGVVAAEVVRVSGSNQHQLVSLSRDPLLQRAAEIFHEVQQSQGASGESFRVVLLRIPSILTEALWLQADDPNASDQLIPILTSTPELEVGKLYPLSVFQRAVQPLAAKFREFDRLPKKPSTSI